MFAERESGFGRMEEEKLKQVKAEAEVATSGVGNKETMEKAAEKRKKKEVVFGVATEFAKKKVERKEGK